MTKLRSRYIQTRSGTHRKLPEHRVEKRSSKKLIKQHDARARSERTARHHTQQRHVEFERDDELYNCITSCDVVNVANVGCAQGLFLALCTKCAICIRDLRIRIEENHRTPDEISSDTHAIYNLSTRNGSHISLPNNRTRFCFVPLDTLLPWNTIAQLLFHDEVCNALFRGHNMVPLPQYSNTAGFWVKLRGVEFHTVLPATRIDTLFAGLNNASVLDCVVNLQPENFESTWMRPLERVQSCLRQVRDAYDMCRPTEEEVGIATDVANGIFGATRLPSVNWSRLADTFMGGLFKFDHNEHAIARDLEFVQNLHYLREHYPGVRDTINNYVSGIQH